MYIYCTYNSKLVKKKMVSSPHCHNLINNENSAGGNILVSELEANITNYIITPLHAYFNWFLFKFNVGLIEDRCSDDAIMNSLVLLYFIKNKFHVAMGLCISRSQKKSKYGSNISNILGCPTS